MSLVYLLPSPPSNCKDLASSALAQSQVEIQSAQNEARAVGRGAVNPFPGDASLED